MAMPKDWYQDENGKWRKEGGGIVSSQELEEQPAMTFDEWKAEDDRLSNVHESERKWTDFHQAPRPDYKDPETGESWMVGGAKSVDQNDSIADMVNGKNPKLAQMVKKLGPSHFKMVDGYTMVSPEARKQISKELGIGDDGFFGKDGPFQAFSKTIGLAMGVSGALSSLTNVPGANMGKWLYEAGSTGNLNAPFGPQSFLQELGANAASQGSKLPGLGSISNLTGNQFLDKIISSGGMGAARAALSGQNPAKGAAGGAIGGAVSGGIGAIGRGVNSAANGFGDYMRSLLKETPQNRSRVAGWSSEIDPTVSDEFEDNGEGKGMAASSFWNDMWEEYGGGNTYSGVPWNSDPNGYGHYLAGDDEGPDNWSSDFGGTTPLDQGGGGSEMERMFRDIFGGSRMPNVGQSTGGIGRSGPGSQGGSGMNELAKMFAQMQQGQQEQQTSTQKLFQDIYTNANSSDQQWQSFLSDMNGQNQSSTQKLFEDIYKNANSSDDKWQSFLKDMNGQNQSSTQKLFEDIYKNANSSDQQWQSFMREMQGGDAAESEKWRDMITAQDREDDERGQQMLNNQNQTYQQFLERMGGMNQDSINSLVGENERWRGLMGNESSGYRDSIERMFAADQEDQDQGRAMMERMYGNQADSYEQFLQSLQQGNQQQQSEWLKNYEDMIDRDDMEDQQVRGMFSQQFEGQNNLMRSLSENFGKGLEGMGQGMSQGFNNLGMSNILRGLLESDAQNKYGDKMLSGMKEASELADPFRKERPFYQDRLRKMNTDPNFLQNDAVFKNMMDPAMRATEARMAAQGYNNSGNMQHELMRTGTETGAKYFLPLMDQMGTNAGAKINPAGAGALFGQGVQANAASDQQSQAGLGYAFKPMMDSIFGGNRGSTGTGGYSGPGAETPTNTGGFDFGNFLKNFNMGGGGQQSDAYPSSPNESGGQSPNIINGGSGGGPNLMSWFLK